MYKTLIYNNINNKLAISNWSNVRLLIMLINNTICQSNYWNKIKHIYIKELQRKSKYQSLSQKLFSIKLKFPRMRRPPGQAANKYLSATHIQTIAKLAYYAARISAAMQVHIHKQHTRPLCANKLIFIK